MCFFQSINNTYPLHGWCPSTAETQEDPDTPSIWCHWQSPANPRTTSRFWKHNEFALFLALIPYKRSVLHNTYLTKRAFIELFSTLYMYVNCKTYVVCALMCTLSLNWEQSCFQQSRMGPHSGWDKPASI